MAKRRKSVKRRAKAPQSWLSKLSGFLSKIFAAPSQEAAKRRKAKAKREIKSRGYSPSYEKRLLRAVETGKTPSLQSARGQKPGEAKRRAEREKAAHVVSSAQIRSIRNFYVRWSASSRKAALGIPVENMIEYAQQHGYEAFAAYRAQWDAMRKQYLRELSNGTYAPRPDALDDAAMLRPVPATKWFYYH